MRHPPPFPACVALKLALLTTKKFVELLLCFAQFALAALEVWFNAGSITLKLPGTFQPNLPMPNVVRQTDKGITDCSFHVICGQTIPVAYR